MAGLNNGTSYVNNGVSINPAMPAVGDLVKIFYDGILVKNGATHLYAHVGFGNKWDNVSDIKMDKSEMGFVASVTVPDSDTMNICFKDCANNWDNNSGKNYSIDISR